MAFIRYAGVMKGIVIDTNDPVELDRVKVRIPQLHGFMDEETYGPISKDIVRKSRMSDEDLPWASVCYPFGSTTQPEVNQVVWIMFVNGDANSPVVIGWAGYEYAPEEILEAQ